MSETPKLTIEFHGRERVREKLRDLSESLQGERRGPVRLETKELFMAHRLAPGVGGRFEDLAMAAREWEMRRARDLRRRLQPASMTDASKVIAQLLMQPLPPPPPALRPRVAQGLLLLAIVLLAMIIAIGG